MDDQKKVYGPILPSNFIKSQRFGCDKNVDGEDDDNDNESYGPRLPPSLVSQQQQQSKPVIGPTLPPGFSHFKTIENDSESNENADKNKDKNYNDDDNNYDDDDDSIIGPLPPGQTNVNHISNQPRKIFKKDSDDPKREKWMLEPGKVIGNTLQIKSVTRFSQKKSKDKPLTEEDRMEIKAKKEKDEKMQEFLNKYEKHNKRSKSLLEKHREDLKKNKKLKPEKTERKEFDRERDLCAPKIDPKSKKTLINQSSTLLTSKFSKGNFEKFL